MNKLLNAFGTNVDNILPYEFLSRLGKWKKSFCALFSTKGQSKFFFACRQKI